MEKGLKNNKKHEVQGERGRKERLYLMGRTATPQPPTSPPPQKKKETSGLCRFPYQRLCNEAGPCREPSPMHVLLRR